MIRPGELVDDLVYAEHNDLLEHVFGDQWELVGVDELDEPARSYAMQFDPPAKVWRISPWRPPVHPMCRCVIPELSPREEAAREDAAVRAILDRNGEPLS